MRQGTVTNLIEEGAQVCGVRYLDADKVVREERAPLTIVVDGCNSNLRKNFTANKPLATSAFVG